MRTRYGSARGGKFTGTRKAVPRQIQRPGSFTRKNSSPGCIQLPKNTTLSGQRGEPATHSGTWSYSTVTVTVFGGLTGPAWSGPAVRRKALQETAPVAARTSRAAREAFPTTASVGGNGLL